MGKTIKSFLRTKISFFPAKFSPFFPGNQSLGFDIPDALFRENIQMLVFIF